MNGGSKPSRSGADRAAAVTRSLAATERDFCGRASPSTRRAVRKPSAKRLDDVIDEAVVEHLIHRAEPRIHLLPRVEIAELEQAPEPALTVLASAHPDYGSRPGDLVDPPNPHDPSRGANRSRARTAAFHAQTAPPCSYAERRDASCSGSRSLSRTGAAHFPVTASPTNPCRSPMVYQSPNRRR